MIVGEPVAQTMGYREHPLAYRQVGREHVLHEVGGPLGHAPAATARAEAPPLAAERYEPFEGTVAAPHPCEPLRQDATAEELPELVDYERRQPNAVGPAADIRGEIAPVPADDGIEHACRR
jgi:hypothetical protein